MPRSTLEVADIFRRHGPTYRQERAGHLSRDQLRVMSDIEACRTAALGGHLERCADCGRERIAYNSCRNRHCPKCQGQAAHDWLQARQAELLPVAYFHVVFTLPAILAALAYHNKSAVYDILFQAASESLKILAADPKHLGAEIGLIAVLHSWGQTLTFHPHVHCIVPGGGIAPEGEHWVPCRPSFFLPVRVLSRLYRRLFLEKLEAAYGKARLQFFGHQAELSNPLAFADLLRQLKSTDWVVYAKRPFAGPQQVLAYLSRYTHRTAIANSRLISLDHGQVTLRWRDYRHPQRPKLLKLSAGEFIRRFLLHVLPPGFHRIRHYGFLSNCQRRQKLGLCRELLACPAHDREAQQEQPQDLEAKPEPEPWNACPHCHGLMVRILTLTKPDPRQAIKWFDSS